MIIDTNAIVLHRMKYKDNSLIARLFTKEEGKISVIVNHASKQKDNLFGIIEPPNIIKLNYYKKKMGSLQTCKNASFLSNNLFIKKDILKLSTALAIVEIIDKTTPENDVNGNIYDLVDNMLELLNKTNIKAELILSYFLLHIASQLGFMPNLHDEENIEYNINKEIKIYLQTLNNCSHQNLSNIENVIIDYNKLIVFFEKYITKHLKLNKKIQSLYMLREITNG